MENQKTITLKQKISNLYRSKSNPIRFAFIFGFASLASWMPLFNVWLEDSGLSGNHIGLVGALPWLIMLFVQPLWGIVSDRHGKLRSMKIALLFSVLFFAIFPLFKVGLPAIVLGTLFMSLFNTPVLPILDSIALDHVERNPSTSYSNIRFWGAPGFGLGAAVTGWLIPVQGISVIFFTSSFFLLLVLLALMKTKDARNERKTIDLQFSGLNKVLSERSLILFLVIIILVSIGQSAITFYFSLYMRQIGASSEITGAAIAIQAFSELPFYFVAAWLLRKMKPDRVIFLAILGTSLRMFLYWINDNPNLVLFIETLNGVTWTLLWIASVEFVNEIVPSKWRTTGQSLLWAGYFGAGAVLGNLVTGRLYQQLHMQEVYLINGIAILVIAVFSAATILFRKKIYIKAFDE